MSKTFVQATETQRFILIRDGFLEYLKVADQQTLPAVDAQRMRPLPEPAAPVSFARAHLCKHQHPSADQGRALWLTTRRTPVRRIA